MQVVIDEYQISKVQVLMNAQLQLQLSLSHKYVVVNMNLHFFI